MAMTRRFGRRFAVTCGLAFVASQAAAQPTINVPPDDLPESVGGSTMVNFMDGAVFDGDLRMRDNSMLNVSGGEIRSVFVDEDASVQMSGGVVSELGLNGEAAISGGNIRHDLIAALETGQLEISGGAFADRFRVYPDTEWVLYGRDFRQHRSLISGLEEVGDSVMFNFNDITTLSGTLADGTPFAFSRLDESNVFEAPVRLVLADVPPPQQMEYLVPVDAAPLGVGAGQVLTLQEGGVLPDNFTAGWGSVVNIEGGFVDYNFEAVGAEVNITGGHINHEMDAFVNSVVRIAGDAQWSSLTALRGSEILIEGGESSSGMLAGRESTVHISGGVMRSGIAAESSSEINVSGGEVQGEIVLNRGVANISGGSIGGLSLTNQAQAEIVGGELFDLSASDSAARVSGGSIEFLGAHNGSEVTVIGGEIAGLVSSFGGSTSIQGGALGDVYQWNGGSVEIQGYDFRVDGVPIEGLENTGDQVGYSYSEGSLFSGTLADGTPFVISDGDVGGGFNIENGVVRLMRVESPDRPAHFTVPTDGAPLGLADERTLLLLNGGRLGNNFTVADGSDVTIQGGEVGNNLEVIQSTASISSGIVGDGLDVFAAATVDVSGGIIGDQVDVHSGGELSVSGGQLGSLGRLQEGSMTTITGGVIGHSWRIEGDAILHVQGGSIGERLAVGSMAELVVAGGSVGRRLEAGDQSSVLVEGGMISDSFRALPGSTVRITNGVIDGGFNIDSGADVELSGGVIGDAFFLRDGAEIRLNGADFRVDGGAVGGLENLGDNVELALEQGQVLTGTLANGSPFAFSSIDSDDIDQGTFRLTLASLALGPELIEVPGDPTPYGVHDNQRLQLMEGGTLSENFVAGRGSLVEVDGGEIGKNFEIFDATVHIHAGHIGRNLDVFHGGVLNVEGGQIDEDVQAFTGSSVNIRGGELTSFEALAGSQVQMQGGVLSEELRVQDAEVMISGGEIHGGIVMNGQSRVNMSGGRVAQFDSSSMSSEMSWAGGSIGQVDAKSMPTGGLRILGDEFVVNGTSVTTELPDIGSELSVHFNTEEELQISGILSDGTPMVLSTTDGDVLVSGVVTLVRSETPMVGPALQVIDEPVEIQGVRGGQTVVVEPGGVLPNLFVAGSGSTVRVEGGAVGNQFRSIGANVLITGGEIGDDFTAFEGSTVELHGGKFGQQVTVYSNSTAAIHGGDFDAVEAFKVFPDATLDIFASEFFLNDVPIAGLEQPGDVLELVEREDFPILAATLQYGERFEIGIYPSRPRGRDFIRDYVNPLATIRLHLIASLSADFNGDRAVTAADLTDPTLGWETRFGDDLDGHDFLDWQRQYTQTADISNVPEASTLVCSVLGILGLALASRGKKLRGKRLLQPQRGSQQLGSSLSESTWASAISWLQSLSKNSPYRGRGGEESTARRWRGDFGR